MLKNLTKVIFTIIGIIVGIISFILIKHFDLVKDDFFDITLTSIIELISYILIVTFLSYMLGNKLSKDEQKRQIVSDLLDDIRNIIQSEENTIEELITKYDHKSKQKLLLRLRTISNKLEALKQVSKKSKLNIEEYLNRIDKEFYSLKEIITGDEWSDKLEYSNNDFPKINRSQQNIIKDIDSAKINIYS